MVAQTSAPNAGQAGVLNQATLPFARQHFILRVAQFIITLGVFALFGAARGLSGANIFAGVWTFLISIYHLSSHYNPKFYNILVAMILDIIGCLIWFGGFISAALWIGALGRVAAAGAGAVVGPTFALIIIGVVCGVLLWISYVAALFIDIKRWRHHKNAMAAAQTQVKMQEHDSISGSYPQNGGYQPNAGYQHNANYQHNVV